MPVALTWNLTDADRPRPWTLDVKVEIFRERVDGWQLWIAQLVANGGDDRHGRHHEKIPHAGFAVLLIVMSYFEMIARYLEGDLIEAKAGEFSKKGFRAVAGSLNQAPDRAPVDQLLADWYKQVRCGLYHTARVRRGLASPEKSATSSSTTARVAPCSSIHTFSRVNCLRAERSNRPLPLSPRKPAEHPFGDSGHTARRPRSAPGDTSLQDGLNSSRCLARPSGMQALQTAWRCCSRARVRSALTAAPAHGPHPW